MPDLFSDCTNAHDLAYKNICSGEYAIEQEMKMFCELLWNKFEPLADTHFLTQIKRSFYERYWEMYLTSSFIDWEFEVASDKHGPDILIQDNGNRIWIEAVTSGNGDPINNPDVVPDIETGIAQLVPEDKIILRLRSSIEEKSRKYHTYIRDGVLDDNEPYVIALNGAKLNFMNNTDDIPLILKSILPIGDCYYNFHTETSGIAHRDTILRENGAGVSTNVFLDEKYQHISAILYSNTHAGQFYQEIGTDFMLIHNPNAANPLPINIVKKGKIIKIIINNESNTFSYEIENV